MFDRICLFGMGGHGKVVRSQIARRWPQTQILCADARFASEEQNAASYGCYADLSDIPEDCAVIVTIGDNATRRSLQTRAESLGLALASFVKDAENDYSEELGSGSMVLGGALVNTGARLGRGVIVNSGAIVEHDCLVGDFCHIAPGSVLSGGCHLGDGVFVGAGAVLLPGCSVPDDTVIGAGAVVTADIVQSGTYVGVPARRVTVTI